MKSHEATKTSTYTDTLMRCMLSWELIVYDSCRNLSLLSRLSQPHIRLPPCGTTTQFKTMDLWIPVSRQLLFLRLKPQDQSIYLYTLGKIIVKCFSRSITSHCLIWHNMSRSVHFNFPRLPNVLYSCYLAMTVKREMRPKQQAFECIVKVFLANPSKCLGDSEPEAC